MFFFGMFRPPYLPNKQIKKCQPPRLRLRDAEICLITGTALQCGPCCDTCHYRCCRGWNTHFFRTVFFTIRSELAVPYELGQTSYPALNFWIAGQIM